MELFVDSADVEAIAELHSTGLVDGVTTNPSLVARTGRDFVDVIREICRAIPGPVSAEVVGTDHKTMLAEGLKLSEIAPNVAVKVPLTLDGLKTCRDLSKREIKVNVTLCFSANQALLAAKAGAAFISPFIGRLDDIHIDGAGLVREIRKVFDNYQLPTKILAASVRTPNHVKQAALSGADIATMPPDVLTRLMEHPLTDKGLSAFLADAATAKLTI